VTRERHLVAIDGGGQSALRTTANPSMQPATRMLQFGPLNDWDAFLVLIELERSTTQRVRDIAKAMRAGVQVITAGDDCPPHGMPRPT
jgi:hypothetical protein